MLKCGVLIALWGINCLTFCLHFFKCVSPIFLLLLPKINVAKRVKLFRQGCDEAELLLPLKLMNFLYPSAFHFLALQFLFSELSVYSFYLMWNICKTSGIFSWLCVLKKNLAQTVTKHWYFIHSINVEQASYPQFHYIKNYIVCLMRCIKWNKHI